MDKEQLDVLRKRAEQVAEQSDKLQKVETLLRFFSDTSIACGGVYDISMAKRHLILKCKEDVCETSPPYGVDELDLWEALLAELHVVVHASVESLLTKYTLKAAALRDSALRAVCSVEEPAQSASDGRAARGIRLRSKDGTDNQAVSTSGST